MKQALEGKKIIMDSKVLYKTIKNSPNGEIPFRILFGLCNLSPSEFTEHTRLLESSGLIECKHDILGRLILKTKRYN